MISNVMWCPFEIPTEKINLGTDNFPEWIDEVVWKGLAQKIMNEMEIYAQSLIQKAIKEGYIHDLYLGWEIGRCELILPIIEGTANVLRFSEYPEYKFIYHPLYLKGVYIKKV